MIEILIFIFLLFFLSMSFSILTLIMRLTNLSLVIYFATLSAIFAGIIFIYIALYGI